MPEPEFFIVLIAAAAVSSCFVGVAALIFFFGWRKKSKALMAGSIVPIGCGALIFAPMFFLLILWIGYWIFGDKTPNPDTQSAPSAENCLQIGFEMTPNPLDPVPVCLLRPMAEMLETHHLSQSAARTVALQLNFIR